MDKNTLDKINALTRRKFKAEELYTFPVVLCHNDIDRDGERFTDDALDQMAALFVGKTGIFDHNPSAENQAARIYDTEVITDPEKETAWGGAYRYLKGYAYMVRTDANADLITEIDAGIKKEVSVSCSVMSRKCSICGANANEGLCEHVRGKTYDGQICHVTLDDITDAYEWSFVAVPAQVGAGVAKQYTTHKGGINMEDFTPITTKEALDAAAAPLIEAAVTAKAAEFEGWVSAEDHQKALDELNAAHKAELLRCYRSKAAMQAGLPEALADRLTGETEEDICKDAELLAGLTKKQATPSFKADDSLMDGIEKSFYEKNPTLAPKKAGKENA